MQIDDTLFEVFVKIEAANNQEEVIQILKDFDPNMVADYLSALEKHALKETNDINQKITRVDEITIEQLNQEAKRTFREISKAFMNLANSDITFENASQSAQTFHEQIQLLTKNLSSLNTIYELELQESNNHLKALNQFYGKLNEASNAMNTTASDAVKAKDQIAALANNLGKLYKIYGNVFSKPQK